MVQGRKGSVRASRNRPGIKMVQMGHEVPVLAGRITLLRAWWLWRMMSRDVPEGNLLGADGS
eukprot:1750548-Karenia_brevis.AAC.1